MRGRGLAVAALWGALLLAQNHSQEIEAHLERARQAIASHDLLRASEEYAQVLNLDPNNIQIQAAQGVTLYALGNLTEAVSALESALELDVGQKNVEIFLGLSRSDLGQYSIAVPLLRKHFNDSTEPKLRRIVGLALLNCYVASSEFDGALDLSRSLKRWYGDDPDVLYTIAELYSHMSKAAVTELLEKHAESYRVHQLAGESLEAQGKAAQAMQEYRKALELNPKLPRVHYHIGKLLLEGPQPDEREAMDHFGQELAINPGDIASRYATAEILRKQNHFEEARRYFSEAIAYNREFVEARIGLAKVYAAEHQPDKALEELQEAIRLRPNEPASHYTLMMIYRDLGRSPEAQRELSIFQQLQAKRESDTRGQLQMLLTGKKPER